MLKNIYIILGCLGAAAAAALFDGWNKLLAVPMFFGVLAALLVVHVLFLLVYTALLSLKKPIDTNGHNEFAWAVILQSIGVITLILRIKLHFKGFEKLPKDRRFLLVSNHRSMLDPIFTLVALGDNRTVFISKPEVMKLPIVGPLMSACGFNAIDRDNPRNALNCINHNAQLIKDDFASVGVYPEGTRTKTGKLLPFHDGVFKIAQKAGVPVAVVTVEGTELMRSWRPWRRTDVYITMHELIENSPDMRLRSHQLASEARSIICKALGEAEE